MCVCVCTWRSGREEFERNRGDILSGWLINGLLKNYKFAKKIVLRIKETLDTFPTEARRPFPRAKDNAGTKTSVFLYFNHFPLLGNETGNHQAEMRRGGEVLNNLTLKRVPLKDGIIMLDRPFDLSRPRIFHSII